MREAWILNGFEAENATEEQTLADLKAKLTLDPCEEAHRLQSESLKEPDRDRHVKALLKQLTNEDNADVEDRLRERQCWEETALETWRSRGKDTGLTDYLEEIEQRLLPLIING